VKMSGLHIAGRFGGGFFLRDGDSRHTKKRLKARDSRRKSSRCSRLECNNNNELGMTGRDPGSSIVRKKKRVAGGVLTLLSPAHRDIRKKKRT